MTSKSNKAKPKFKKKRKKKSKIYFGTPVQNAVIRYNATDNPVIKNRIYKEHIQFAFNKLAENLIHTFKGVPSLRNLLLYYSGAIRIDRTMLGILF